MIKAPILFLIPIVVIAEIIDFGVHGNQYNIEELNGDDMIKKALSQTNYKTIEKDLKSKIEDLKTSHVKLKTSAVDLKNEEEDIYYSTMDIKGVYGETIYRQGEKIPTTLPLGIRIEFCFVDGSLLKPIVETIVESFGKKCVYFVNNKNIDEFAKDYGVKAFPIGGQNLYILNRYAVNALPTKITRYKNRRIRETIDVERLIVELEQLEK